MADHNAAPPSSPKHRFAHLFQRLPLGPLIGDFGSISGQDDRSPVDLEKSADGTTVTGSDEGADIHQEDLDRRRDVRTIPPWIYSLTSDQSRAEQPEVSYLSPTVPNSSHPPHHPYVPTAKPETGRGKLMDSGRNKQPNLVRTPFVLAAPKWQAYRGTTQIKRDADLPSEQVSDAWIKENIHDLDAPWNPDGMADEPAKDETLWLLSNDKRNATLENFRVRLFLF